MNSKYTLLLYISSVIALHLFSCTAKAHELKDILILNSYHHGFKWTSDINNTIVQHFEDEETTRIFSEFMDSKRFHSDAYFDNLKKQYVLKYKHHPIDGIICSDNRAFDFFLEHGSEIWGDIPAVFCGVNNIDEQLHLLDVKKHAIVYEQIDIDGTLELIYELQPMLEEVVVVSDETLSGNIFLNQFITAFDRKQRPYSYQIINNTQPEKLKAALNKIDTKNKAIYLMSLYTNYNGIPNEMIAESRYFFDGIKIPIYSNWDFLMPKLLTGGKILKASDQGLMSAQLIQKLISKEDNNFHNHPPQHTIIDFELLNANLLTAENISGNFLFINKQGSFIERHKKELIIILIILIVFIFIILLLVSDIIKRKSVEINFINSEKRLELAINGANEGLWDVNLDQNNIYVNKQFANLLSYNSSNELNLKLNNWQKYILPQDIEQVKEAYNLHMTGKTNAFQCEARLLKKDKTPVWFSIHGKITERFNQEPTRITGIILDIHNQKAFENELQKAKEKAEESDRLKSSFLANMSHEIRTPMNAILGFTDLLIFGNLKNTEQEDYLNMIKRSGENLLSLINDIIDISKIESGELKISEEKIILNELFDEIHQVANSLCNSLGKNIDLKFTDSTNKNQIIYSDPLRIYQILINLLSNAIKFTDKGFVEVSYQVTPDEKLELCVKDTGPGISPKDRELIFDRFRQVDESTIKKHGGTGLGLSITKSLVGLMNGHITLLSKPKSGSTFTVQVPIKTNSNTLTPVASS
ncbi:PAS domain-containing protein [Carboxylicivirga sp. M1479]|uniref:PAS domain-containing protein n=1 Tax=Carboxylicivirga sp. M1479 TaxID=2594476 RepID=UPI00117765C2|nr:PAS domain-containing protein [Carboxylicivirga sp. M1479]TRX70462.1 PAS domain S-box protein [Carboxylicivirga sp. M1479]